MFQKLIISSYHFQVYIKLFIEVPLHRFNHSSGLYIRPLLRFCGSFPARLPEALGHSVTHLGLLPFQRHKLKIKADTRKMKSHGR